MKEPQIKSIMTPFPYSVELAASLVSAQKMMLEHSVRHLPVTHLRELRGLITDRDIQMLLGSDKQIGPDPALRYSVQDAFIPDCYSVDLEQPLHVVLRTMADRRIGSAVVTTHGRLAGIFTTTDACRAFADHLDTQFRPGQGEPPNAA